MSEEHGTWNKIIFGLKKANTELKVIYISFHEIKLDTTINVWVCKLIDPILTLHEILIRDKLR